MWRLLCLLTGMSVLLAVTGLLWLLPPVWQGVAVAPGLVVTLLMIVAHVASSRGSGRGSESCGR